MGGKCPHRKVKKRRYSHKTSRRTKFEIKDILSVVFSLFFSQAFSLFLVDFLWIFLWTLWLIFLTTSLWITWRCCLWEPSEDRWGEEAVACRWRSSWDGPVLLLALRVNYLVLGYCEYIYIFFINRFGFCVLFCNWFEFFVFFEFVSYFFDLSSRYFASVAVRDEHFKTKRHRKRYVLIFVHLFILFGWRGIEINKLEMLERLGLGCIVVVPRCV